MNWARKGFVGFLAFILFISLLWGVSAYNVQANLSHPEKIETWLAESGIYDNLVNAALSQAQQDGDKNGTSISVSYKNAEVQKAAQSAFSKDLLKSNVNKFIEANYSWLSGKTPVPEFSIDLTEAKKNFAGQVGKYVTEHLAALPACTPEQLAKLQIPVDPSIVSCRPGSLDPKTEGDRVAEEVANSQDFLEKPVITADSLNGETSKPYYEKLKNLPKFYQVGQHLAWIMALVALICTIGIIFIHPSHRKGIRRVGTTLTLAGVLLIATKLVSDKLTDGLKDYVLTGGTKGQLDEPLTKFLHTAESQLSQSNVLFGTILVVIGIVIFVYLFVTRDGKQRKQPPKHHQTNISTPTENKPVVSDPVSQSTAPVDHGDLSNRLRPQRPSGPPPLGTRPAQRPPARAGQPTTPNSSRPRPPRPPRLIQ